MEHGGTERSDGDEQHQGPEPAGQARQGNENHRQQESHQNEAAGGVAVRQVAHRRLHDKGQQARHPGDGPHLGQGKPQLFDEQGEKGAGEGAVEIPGEVDQGQGEQDFDIGFFGRGGIHALMIRSVGRKGQVEKEATIGGCSRIVKIVAPFFTGRTGLCCPGPHRPIRMVAPAAVFDTGLSWPRKGTFGSGQPAVSGENVRQDFVVVERRHDAGAGEMLACHCQHVACVGHATGHRVLGGIHPVAQGCRNGNAGDLLVQKSGVPCRPQGRIPIMTGRSIWPTARASLRASSAS
jgi:hypothetical protein